MTVTVTEILTVSEAAKLLKMNRTVLRTMASNGDISCFKLGREYRFTTEDIQDFIRRNRVVARQEASA